MKGYKITDARRTRKVGIACSTLKELRSKGCQKFNFDPRVEDKVIIQLEDGTIVDDEAYFNTLPKDTLFLLLLPGENAITGAEIIYNALKTLNVEYLRAGEEASKFFTENMKKKFFQLASLLDDSREERKEKLSTTKRFLSSKEDDPDWFEGLDTRANTKEKFMFRRSQDRIRGYSYKSNMDLRNSSLYKQNKEARAKLDEFIACAAKQLTSCEYFGSYFDRKADISAPRLCNESGDFWCKGSWQASCCKYHSHTINPYDSREARIIFSTWNLDHRIERSRSIVPAILDAATIAVKEACHINWEYFFTLLFTADNLKLVHIVCHDKGAHTIRCDHRQYVTTVLRKDNKNESLTR